MSIELRDPTDLKSVARRSSTLGFLTRVIRANFLFCFETRNESRAIKPPAHIQIIIIAIENEFCDEFPVAFAASCWFVDGLVVGCKVGSKLGACVVGFQVGLVVGSFVGAFVGFDVGSWVSVVGSLVGFGVGF